jgi:hypothetical protein
MGIAFPPKPPKFPPATIAGSHVELVWAGCLARHIRRWTVLLSAGRVGLTGKAYGLDMIDEMLALAEENKPQERPGQCRVSERRNRKHSASR